MNLKNSEKLWPQQEYLLNTTAVSTALYRRGQL